MHASSNAPPPPIKISTVARFRRPSLRTVVDNEGNVPPLPGSAIFATTTTTTTTTTTRKPQRAKKSSSLVARYIETSRQDDERKARLRLRSKRQEAKICEIQQIKEQRRRRVCEIGRRIAHLDDATTRTLETKRSTEKAIARAIRFADETTTESVERFLKTERRRLDAAFRCVETLAGRIADKIRNDERVVARVEDLTKELNRLRVASSQRQREEADAAETESNLQSRAVEERNASEHLEAETTRSRQTFEAKRDELKSLAQTIREALRSEQEEVVSIRQEEQTNAVEIRSRDAETKRLERNLEIDLEVETAAVAREGKELRALGPKQVREMSCASEVKRLIDTAMPALYEDTRVAQDSTLEATEENIFVVEETHALKRRLESSESEFETRRLRTLDARRDVARVRALQRREALGIDAAATIRTQECEVRVSDELRDESHALETSERLCRDEIESEQRDETEDTKKSELAETEERACASARRHSRDTTLHSSFDQIRRSYEALAKDRLKQLEIDRTRALRELRLVTSRRDELANAFDDDNDDDPEEYDRETGARKLPAVVKTKTGRRPSYVRSYGSDKKRKRKKRRASSARSSRERRELSKTPRRAKGHRSFASSLPSTTKACLDRNDAFDKAASAGLDATGTSFDWFSDRLA
eukprot:g873.t1